MFGSNQYGDLSATISAIILDAESRIEVLDADPMYGSIREPLIKVISMMRTLEYEHTWKLAGEKFVSLGHMESRIGKFVEEVVMLILFKIFFYIELTCSFDIPPPRSNGT